MSTVQGRLTLANSRVWHHVSMKDRVLGRVANKIAQTLMGKHKPVYHSAADNGDYVVATDCEHMIVTGKKMDQQIYYRHSGKPGHLKEMSMRRLKARFGGAEILRRAVSGMLPKNRLRAPRLERLKAFDGVTHPYRPNLVKLHMEPLVPPRSIKTSERKRTPKTVVPVNDSA